MINLNILRKQGVKILIWDIETCPNLILDFQCGYNKVISPQQVIEERKVVSIQYMYLGDKKVKTLNWEVKGQGVGAKRCDKKMLEKFGEILRTCDLAVAHNGDNFDYKWVKGRNMYHRLPPITGVRNLDTYKLSRSNFNLNSHSLDHLSRFLFAKRKLKTDFSLWVNVWMNDRQALAYMLKYGKKDVLLLKDAFLEMLPYLETMPASLSMVMGGTRDGCPVCAGTDNVKHAFRYTRVGKYQKYQCKGCGHIWADSRMLKEESK